ncbi:DUF3108 domain-containing protein [Falsirhodobacter sp. 20TX0035]|uniref:DUF3108 domain-containing protein n=1 Tax=Falsirhodobacter sp. 20TX0035 TaxID=3022019 RepID=UPI00232C2213|nr:DUF3108 domain-containing protein [Falsirhodobacter sp. 20TX0035]MDB6454882.1 DUF3108 domain-containing protein [Falsirhodobacter sp. 20TX0035]
MLKILALLTPLLLALPAQAETAVYGLTIRGVSAGTLQINGEVTGNRYAVSGSLQSGGLVGILRSIRYDASAQGRVVGDRFVPSAYSERSDNNGRTRSATMEYRSGVPQVKAYDPPRKPDEDDVNPATQGGTVDTLTALYAALRDVPAGQECGRSLRLFDGRRATEVAFSAPRRQNGTTTCNGEFRRIAGYSEKEMAEKRVFPFMMTYKPAGDMMRVTEIRTDTLYGAARLIRR